MAESKSAALPLGYAPMRRARARHGIAAQLRPINALGLAGRSRMLAAVGFDRNPGTATLHAADGIDARRRRAIRLERFPFRLSRKALQLLRSGRIFCGKPASTFPENALMRLR